MHFTLTVDCTITKAAMKTIARSLIPFGRVFFRINHECNGSWFQHNKRFSYGQVGAFFCRFHDVVKEEAPSVQTVLCINGVDVGDDMRLGPRELGPAVAHADVIGIDRYTGASSPMSTSARRSTWGRRAVGTSPPAA